MSGRRTWLSTFLSLMIIITHIIIKKYSVDPIDFVYFFDMDEIMRGAAWCKPLNLSFFWVVRSEPPFVLYRRVHDVYQNTACCQIKPDKSLAN